MEDINNVNLISDVVDVSIYQDVEKAAVKILNNSKIYYVPNDHKLRKHSSNEARELKYFMKKFYDKTELNIPYHTPDQKEFYFKRCAEFDEVQIGFDKIVFLGDSITEGGGNWNNYFGTKSVVNRGISGDTTLGVLARLNEICFYKPISLFLLIGINLSLIHI